MPLVCNEVNRMLTPKLRVFAFEGALLFQKLLMLSV
jgi:hypothetical protein